MIVILWHLGAAVCGYLLDCINMAAILANHRGFDIRKKGSGNAGASNALVTMGKTAAVCSALFDMFKSFLPVLLLRHVFTLPEGCAVVPVLGGVCAVFGHIFPFWMQFRGGKGFASLLGLSLALDWRFYVAGLLLTTVVTLTLKYIAIASVSCALLLPVAWYIRSGELTASLLLLALGLVIVFKHRENLRRIRNGTEIGFGQKKMPDYVSGKDSAPDTK